MKRGRIEVLTIVTVILLFIIGFSLFNYFSDFSKKDISVVVVGGIVGSVCGDGVCEGGENAGSCADDCPVGICNDNRICEGLENYINCNRDCTEAISPELNDIIDKIWNNRKSYFIDTINSNLANGNPYPLYYTQGDTNNLLKYSYYMNDYNILSGLAEVYLTAYTYLDDRNGYKEWICGESCQLWSNPSYTNKEIPLVSAQYIYLLSNAISIISSISENNRLTKMTEMATSYTPVIINDHLKKWIFEQEKFSVGGWGCEDRNYYNHREFIEKKLRRELGTRYSYCNAVMDSDMWIIAATAEMLIANSKDPVLVPMKATEKEKFLEYLNVGIELIESRLTESNLIDFNGNPVKGLNFDLGVWDGYPDYAYSGYLEDSFPTETDKIAGENVGWDISHARRFVHVFNSLYENKELLGQSFPNRNVMIELTNQVVYGTFNKNFKKPLFTNYMDGTNGWYRVNYSGEGFSYAPYDLSISILVGGYGFLSKFNPDMSKIAYSLWTLFESQDSVLIEHRQGYYGSYYYNGIRINPTSFDVDTSLDILMFLSSLVAVTDRCSDSLDNDNDLAVDYPNDPDCESPMDNSEQFISLDKNKVYIKNPQAQNMVWFGDRGNIVLKGTCQVSSTCISSVDSFIFKNSAGETVAYIDTNGNLCIETGDCSSGTSCNPTANDEFIMQNEQDKVVSYINLNNGDLCYIGRLIENADWSMLGSEPQCNDGIDNNGNSLIDMSDPGCSDLQDNDEKPYCTDSDNGKDYGVRGETFGQTNCGANRCGQSTVVDKCENNVRLDEFYCGNNGYVYVDFYDCSNGCLDGTCKT